MAAASRDTLLICGMLDDDIYMCGSTARGSPLPRGKQLARLAFGLVLTGHTRTCGASTMLLRRSSTQDTYYVRVSFLNFLGFQPAFNFVQHGFLLHVRAHPIPFTSPLINLETR